MTSPQTPRAEVEWKTSRRARSSLVLATRFAGHLPYFLLAPGLLLPEALSLPAAAAIALTHSVVCHEISADLSARQLTEANPPGPFGGACLLFAILLLCVPVIIFLLSPASYGAALDTPHAVLPAMAVLVLPCCFAFALAQQHGRSRDRVLFRLGLVAVTRRKARD